MPSGIPSDMSSGGSSTGLRIVRERFLHLVLETVKRRGRYPALGHFSFSNFF